MFIKNFKPIKQKIGKVLKVSKVQVKTIPVKIQWLYNNLRGKSGTLQRKVFKVALFAVLPTVIGGILTELVANWDFNGVEEDELTVSIGDKLWGVSCNDDWWVAQTSSGKLGLIPVSYVSTQDDKATVLDRL